MLNRTPVALALAAFILGTSAALRYAESVDAVSADAGRRTIQVLIGLILAAYANIMPKEIGRWRGSARAASRSQSALRVGGWSLTVAGLAYAAFWAFTPIGFADAAGMAVVAAATTLTAAYGAWAFLACRRSGRSSPAQ
jgi:hypothetical protein